MECRGCGRQIPDDTVMCLLCGTRQDPRIQDLIEVRRKNSGVRPIRWVLASATMAATILLAAFAIPIFSDFARNDKLAKIEQTAHAKDLDAFIHLASQFYSRYPDSAEMQNIFIMANGLGLKTEIETSSPPSPMSTPQTGTPAFLPQKGTPAFLPKSFSQSGVNENANPALPASAEPSVPVSDSASPQNFREQVIEVSELSWRALKQTGAVRCELKWKNNSAKTVTEAAFTLEALDKDGNPALCEIRKTPTANVRTTGDFKPSAGNPDYVDNWVDLWINKNITSVNISKIRLTYIDNSVMEISGSNIGEVVNYG